MVTKFLSVAIFTVNGCPDREAMDLEYARLADEACAAMKTDFDTIKGELNAWLLTAPGLKTLAEKTIARELWMRRVVNGEVSKDLAARTAEEERLNSVLGAYIRATPEQFHVGKKLGVAFNYADGEYVKNEKTGEILVDGEGNAVQHYRHTAAQWKEMGDKKAASVAAAIVKKAA